ncbi:MAG: ATP synthase subunit I [Acidobacteriia bacterium]|nr:ATP synthase subunit I [Terriglobia bacterium]
MEPETANSLEEPAGAAESFYSRALPRISRFMFAVSVIGSAAAWVVYGWRVAAGFACGAAIAYLNFHWLKRAVNALADAVTQTGQRQSSKGIVLRFLLRYVLMGLGAYVILTVSPASLSGLFAGLFVPVGAIACEAAYEVYVTVARGL